MLVTFLVAAPYTENCFDIHYGVVGETRDLSSNAAIALVNDGKAVLAGPRKTRDEMFAEFLAELAAARAKKEAA